MMLINLDDPINGFCKNKEINSIPLYLVKDISDLESSDLITNEQKKFLKSAFQLEINNFGFFPDINLNLAGAVAIITSSKEPRKSIIDQSASISKKVPKFTFSKLLKINFLFFNLINLKSFMFALNIIFLPKV